MKNVWKSLTSLREKMMEHGRLEYSEWEMNFVANIFDRMDCGRSVSWKQFNVLDRIFSEAQKKTKRKQNKQMLIGALRPSVPLFFENEMETRARKNREALERRNQIKAEKKKRLIQMFEKERIEKTRRAIETPPKVPLIRTYVGNLCRVCHDHESRKGADTCFVCHRQEIMNRNRAM